MTPTSAKADWRAGAPATIRSDRSLMDGHCGATLAAGPRRGRRDRGSTTAELAASLPALVLLLLAGLSCLTAVRTQIECVDAAREAARAAARGVPVTSRMPGASVTVTTEGDLVRATVVVRWSPLGGVLPGFDVSATSVAAVEPS